MARRVRKLALQASKSEFKSLEPMLIQTSLCVCNSSIGRQRHAYTSGSLMASPSSRDSELPVKVQTLSHSRTVDSDRGGHQAFALPPTPTWARTHARTPYRPLYGSDG